MIVLKVIVAIVALRSFFMTFLTWKSYIHVSTRKPAAFLAALCMIVVDIFIICVSVRYVIEGGF